MSPVGNSEGFEELICWKIGLKPLLKTWVSRLSGEDSGRFG